MDILVRLALASGFELLCAISAQCAACSRYAATFALPDIQSPYVFRRQLKAATTGIWFRIAQYWRVDDLQSQKALAVSRCESSTHTLSPLFAWLCILG